VTQRLARVPGIHRAVTSNITRIVKREHAFPILPGETGDGHRRNGRATAKIGEGKHA